jgi:hypothetical protein
MKSRNERRRIVLTIDLVTPFWRPVARIRNVPLAWSRKVLSALPTVHWVLRPTGGSSSIVYSAVVPGTLRHWRGSVCVELARVKARLTGLFSPPPGPGFVVQRVQ